MLDVLALADDLHLKNFLAICILDFLRTAEILLRSVIALCTPRNGTSLAKLLTMLSSESGKPTIRDHA
jgi:hypothetical protein